MTYKRQGCKNKGLRASTHGIVHEEHKKPRLVQGEPDLGYPPVRMTVTANGQVLAKESRVDYSKLRSVQHNVKVYFIGRILERDFVDVVIKAVDECSTRKAHDPEPSTKANT